MHIGSIDLSIIASYLVLTIIIGIYFGRGIKNFKDFSVGHQRFAVPILTITVLSSVVGGNSTLGTVARIYEVGAVFLFVIFGYITYQIVVSRYLAPQFVRFKSAVSLGDIMETKFGTPGRIISGCIAISLATGGIGAQITALGLTAKYLVGWPFELSVIISSGIVVLYSAYGGVRSVVFTDVFQFMVLIVALPLMCIVGIHKIGGYESLITHIPTYVFKPTRSEIFSHFILLIILSIPQLGLGIIQRLLLSKDSVVLSKSFKFSAALNIPLYAVIFLIGLTTLALYPDINPQDAFFGFIGELPVGIKGLAIAGLMAVVMSTADTVLNAASVFVVKDLLRPLFPKKIHHNNDLFITRILTVIIGSVSICSVLYYCDIFDVYLSGKVLWMPVILCPLYAVLFDLPGSLKDFFRGGIAGFCTFLIWSFVPLSTFGVTGVASLEKITYINALLPAFLMNGMFFFKGKIYRVIQNAIRKEKEATQHVNYHLIAQKPFSLKVWFINKTHEAKAPYSYVGALGMAMFITPLFYFDLSQNDNLLITLKIIVCLMILCIILRKDWFPQKRLPFCICWHISLSGAFMAVPCVAYVRSGLAIDFSRFTSLQAFSQTGQLDNQMILALSGIVLLFVVQRYLFSLHSVSAVLFSMGVSYTYVGTPFTKSVAYVSYFFIILNVICYMIVGRVLRLKEQQIKVYRAHVAKIIHEMTTPLACIGMDINNARTFLQKREIKKAHHCLDRLDKITDHTAKFIDIHKKTVAEQKKSKQLYHIRTKDFAEHLFFTFPFDDEEIKSMFHMCTYQDFTFTSYMNIDVLCSIVHNLMRNASYAIQKTGMDFHKGRIDISIQAEEYEVKMCVQDNGCGMTPFQQHQVFNPFYTTKEYGVGVGLAFCKEAVEVVGGEILCSSTLNEGTEFTIMIPFRNKVLNKAI